MDLRDSEDDYDGLCGEIYWTLKKCLIFHCLLCDGKYKNGFKYLLHMQNHGADAQSLNDPDAFLLEAPSSEDDVNLEISIMKTEEMTLISSEDLLAASAELDSLKEASAQPEKNNRRKSKGMGTLIVKTAEDSAGLFTQAKNRLSKGKSKPQRGKSQSQVAEQVVVKQRDKLVLFVAAEHEGSNDPLASSTAEFSEKKKEQRPVQCPYCHLTCPSRKEYHKHKVTTHRISHKCPTCEKVFKHMSAFTRHVNQHNTIDESFRCQVYRCFREFKTQTELEFHKEIHQADVEKADGKEDYERPYKCHICGFRMKDSSNMVNHLKRHDERNKKLECRQCSKKFFTKTELNAHERRHTGERPYLCPECGESYPTSGELYNHKKQKHLVMERKYKCSICTLSFAKKTILVGHMSVHQEERNFACTECDAKFKRKKGLLSHLKIHQNQLAYRCQLCDKRFNQSAALCSHMKTHKLESL